MWAGKKTEDNLGQMFMVGFNGCDIDDNHPVVEDIMLHNVGGILLFDRNVDGSRQNIVSPGQLKALIEKLQKYGQQLLLISVDQEGGRVCRLKERDGFPGSVDAGSLGSLDNIEKTRIESVLLAESLAQAGINLNLAPVVDLAINPTNPVISRYKRSFGVDPKTVVRHASVFIKEHHRCGIACCLKHFPGHGSSGTDSHQGFVDVTTCWKDEELVPYKELIGGGFSDSVMSAHIVNRRLDPNGLPATLSAPVLSDMLRKEIGFKGVVISDDMQMRAISDFWRYEEAVQKAVVAGVDLIIVGNNLARERDIVKRGIGAIKELLASGRIKEKQLQESLERIGLLKKKINKSIPW